MKSEDNLGIGRNGKCQYLLINGNNKRLRNTGIDIFGLLWKDDECSLGAFQI